MSKGNTNFCEAIFFALNVVCIPVSRTCLQKSMVLSICADAGVEKCFFVPLGNKCI